MRFVLLLLAVIAAAAISVALALAATGPAALPGLSLVVLIAAALWLLWRRRSP